MNINRHSYWVEGMTAAGRKEIRPHPFYFFDPARTAQLMQRDRVLDLVTAQDKQICEVVRCNPRTGVYRGGVLSPKHKQGVSGRQARVAEAHGRSRPLQSCAAMAAIAGLRRFFA